MQTRRKFLAGLLALPFSSTVLALNQAINGPTPNGQMRRAWVANPQLVIQSCPQWCWAASIAMIFDSLGHPINQQTIVQATFGGNVCAPASNTLTIAANLSRSWIDLNGNPFHSIVTAAYDPANNINLIDNNFIINELSNNKPLLYCNSHHAMVLVSMEYFNSLQGPLPQVCGVFDPWPNSPGYHMLSPPEMVPVHHGGQMTFLAAVSV